MTDNLTSDSDYTTGEIELPPGDYAILYSLTDASDNRSVCRSNLEIIDTISPRINCRDVVYEVDPLLEDLYLLIESDLDFDLEDNCGISSFNFSPRDVTCNELNGAIEYTVEATDESGNSRSCKAFIQAEPMTLSPSFASGLCFADTLRLFSNLPISFNFRRTIYRCQSI